MKMLKFKYEIVIQNCLRNVPVGIVSILDGLVSVLSLGNYSPSLTFKYLAWFTKQQLKCRKQKVKYFIQLKN